VTPSGLGHLSFDIWLTDRSAQTSGFGVPPITHEIMIPLDYWGNYGAHPNGREPGGLQPRRDDPGRAVARLHAAQLRDGLDLHRVRAERAAQRRRAAR
jgi:hypothetical protein